MEASSPSARIRLSRWNVQVAVGAYDHEKLGTQELVLDLSIGGDFSLAAASDNLSDALDYAALKGDIEEWINGKRWRLLESFASDLCREVLKRPAVGQVELTVGKPAALAPALVSYTLIMSK